MQGDRGLNSTRQPLSLGLPKYLHISWEISGDFRIFAVKNMIMPLQALSLFLNSPLKLGHSTLYST